jgi:hypothetical protein
MEAGFLLKREARERQRVEEKCSVLEGQIKGY